MSGTGLFRLGCRTAFQSNVAATRYLWPGAHNEALAEAVVQQALKDLSLERYADLLKDLFLVLAKVDVKAVRRNDDTPRTLLEECKRVQSLRNGVLHRGGP